MTRPPFDERLQAAKAAMSVSRSRHEAQSAEKVARGPAQVPVPQPEIYFAAVPFTRNAQGELVAGRALKQPSAGAAEGEARRMAKTTDGAIAFSRSGDSTRGTFEEMVVIRTFGDVPAPALNAATSKPEPA